MSMKTQRFFHQTALAGLLIAFSNSLTACENCEDYDCAPCTLTENITLRLDTSSQPGGFSAAEVRDAYLVRYAPPGFLSPLDSLRTRLCDGNTYCAISLDSYPLPVATGGQAALKYTYFNYRVILPKANRIFSLSNLEVASGPGGEGCCSCPSNIRRRLVLDGMAVADDGGGMGNGFLLRR